MNKSLADLIKKYSTMDRNDILDIYLTSRFNTLLELKDKIKGYPINGILGGVILEKDINMWISDKREFRTDIIEVLRNKQSIFELTKVPVKGSVIASILPSTILTLDIDRVDDKTCFITEDYAEMLEIGDLIEFKYLADEE